MPPHCVRHALLGGLSTKPATPPSPPTSTEQGRAPAAGRPAAASNSRGRLRLSRGGRGRATAGSASLRSGTDRRPTAGGATPPAPSVSLAPSRSGATRQSGARTCRRSRALQRFLRPQRRRRHPLDQPLLTASSVPNWVSAGGGDGGIRRPTRRAGQKRYR